MQKIIKNIFLIGFYITVNNEVSANNFSVEKDIYMFKESNFFELKSSQLIIDSLKENKLTFQVNYNTNNNQATENVLAIINKVNTYWQENNPYPGNSFWHVSAYHTGNIEAYKITNNPIFLKYSKDWANKNEYKGATSDDKSKWEYNYGETQEHVLFGDWQICFQTYIDIYNIEGQSDFQKIARAREVMEYQMSTNENDYWWWADGLYMVMPVMTKLYNVTGNELYLEKLKEYFTYADNIMYDVDAQLYYRDARYVYPNHKSVNVKKDFWARGAGWVFAGLAKILQDLPKNAVNREVYLSRFRAMADALADAQQEGGYWTRSILDPEHAPGPETSGTAFFTYGFLWGMNNGILNQKKYAPVVNKSWNYLKNVAFQENGKVGFVQPIGDKAIPGQIVDANSTSDFGVGAFLLAASEMYRYVDNLSSNILFFDFGTESSPLVLNANKITNTSVYNNENNGFIEITDLTAKEDFIVNQSETDYVSGTSPGTFKVDLYNGLYNLTVVQGTNTTALSGQTIKANGIEVLSNGISNIGEWNTTTFEVSVTNNILELEFGNANEGNNIWVVNSILINTKKLTVNNLSILEDNETIFEDDNFQLTLETFPVNLDENDVTWRSSNSATATVDTNGLVTAKSLGETTIYASMYNEKLIDSCIINVKSKILLTGDLIFDFGTSTSPLIENAIRIDESTKLNESYGWLNPNDIMSRDRGSSFSNPDLDFVLTSSDKEFQVFLENGIYKVTTTHGDNMYRHDNMVLLANDINVADNFRNSRGEYITNEFEVTITDHKLSLKISDNGGSDVNWVWNTLQIVKTGDLSNENIILNEEFKIQPNPVDDVLKFQNSYNNSMSKVEIYSILGNKFFQGNKLNSINVSNLERGIYIIVIHVNTSSIVVRRFIKK